MEMASVSLRTGFATEARTVAVDWMKLTARQYPSLAAMRKANVCALMATVSRRLGGVTATLTALTAATKGRTVQS